MKHFPRLGALALAVALTTSACAEGSRRPVYYPGSARPSVGERDGNGNGSARPNKDKDKDGTRCNAGRGNGNGNGRCRNGNRGRGNG